MFDLHKKLIDPALFKDFKSNNGMISFDLYEEKEQAEDTLTATGKLKLKDMWQSRNAACFYGMHSSIAANPKFNRVCVIFSRHNSCKEHNFLPDYIPTKAVVDRGSACIALDLHTYNQVYVYLTVIRFLQDEPGHIGAMLKFMELGMKFIPAMFAAGKVSVGNSNHHFLAGRHCTGNYYAKIDNLPNEEVHVNGMVGLYRFIYQHDKFNVKGVSGSFFSCNSSIEKAGGGKAILLPVAMLLHPGIELLFLAETAKELDVVVSMLNKTTKKNKNEGK